MAGADAAHIVVAQRLAGGDIGHGIERAAENDRRLFAFRRAVFDAAAREICLMAGFDQCFEADRADRRRSNPRSPARARR